MLEINSEIIPVSRVYKEFSFALNFRNDEHLWTRLIIIEVTIADVRNEKNLVYGFPDRIGLNIAVTLYKIITDNRTLPTMLIMRFRLLYISYLADNIITYYRQNMKFLLEAL